MMGSKFPWESPGFLMTYSTTGIPIEESSNMTHHGKNFLISACEKSPTLTPFLMMPIRSTPKPARSLGNQCEILPPISNNGRINSLNPTLMANASYTSKPAFSRKSDPGQTSTQNHPDKKPHTRGFKSSHPKGSSNNEKPQSDDSRADKKTCKDKSCFYCKKPGHWINECRKKAVDEEKTNTSQPSQLSKN